MTAEEMEAVLERMLKECNPYELEVGVQKMLDGIKAARIDPAKLEELRAARRELHAAMDRVSAIAAELPETTARQIEHEVRNEHRGEQKERG